MNPSGHIVVIRRDGTDGLTCDWCSPLCDIGSNQSCDIRVQHSTVAPFHCTLQLLKDGLVQAVSRVDGRYKMLVNNFPLNDACVLTDNCILTVGDRQFRFFYPPSRKTTSDDYLYEASSKASSHYNKEEVLTPTSLPLVHPSKRTTPRKILLNHKTRSPRQRSMTPKRTLGTSERYGPVPPRQPATPPIIQVLRHEPNSSQSNKLPVFQAENVESNKKSVSGGKGYSYTDVNVSKSNQLKSSVVPDLPNAAHHPSSSVLSSIKGRSQNRIHTPFITSTLPNDDLNFTPNENKRSPGFRKSFHKLLILNESSNQSNLCKIDQFYDELSYVKQQAIESKRSPSTGQENQFCYDKCINDPTEESSREYIPELLTSPNSQRITRKSLSAKSSQKISIAYSPETEQELINRNRKRTISGKTYPTAEDMLATKRRRGVSFGPPLSPERFDKSLPPSTPVKRGGTPLVKLSHSTPANHSLQVNSVVWHSATPFASKLSELSQLSAFSKTTCESPNYNVTNNRVSAVISLPPTPDTNLLNSLSTDISCTHESFATLPVTSAAYSAPIKKSKINRKNLKRHSIAFLEKTSKTPSLRVPPTSPVSTKQKDKKQSTNEQRAKYQEKRAQSFDTNNNKTYNNNNYNKLYSSASYSLPNITKEYKQRRRTSSVPPTNLTETEAVTPEMSLSSVRKESGLTGVRKLLKTPKSVQTPRVSGVSELFKDEPSVKRHRGRPSSVPPTDLTETEAVTPEMSLSSVRKESGLTGVRKLLKTPKSVQTPRVSGVSELFKDEPSVKRHRGRPSSVPPTDLTETEAVTPEMSLSSVRKESGLTGVRKLLKTPKSVQTPRVSGVSELFKDEPSVKRHRGRPSSVPPTDLTETEAVTPEMSLSSVRKESGLTGVRKLLKTPKSVQTPRVSGVSELFKDEPSVKRHRGRPSSVPPTDLTETEAVTPEMSLSSVRKESGLTGVRKLLKTPKSVQTPRVSGVSELFKDEPSVKRHRGRPSSVPPTDLTETEAVTPEMSLSSVRKESGLTGVRKLLKTPKSVQTPRVSGVSELFKDEPSVKRHRGRPSSVPPTDLTETEAVTPEMSLSSVRKESGLTGVRKLLKTPKSVQTPRVSGVSELFKDEPSVKRHRGRPSSVPPTDLTETEAVTPEMSLSSVRKESGLTGVRKLLKTPKSVQTPRVSGVSELFKDEPSVKRHRGRPSSVPPTDLTETEAVTPEMSLSSVRKESGLTGVRKLLKTPKSVQTPRVSGVSELFKDEPSVKRHRGRPSSVPPTDLTETEAVTPEMSLSSVRKESGLTGVRKLLKTPKSVQTPRVSGVSELFKDEPSVKRHRGRPSSVPPTDLTETEAVTPEMSLSSVRKESGLTGVRKLLKTPKSVQTPRVSGVSELFKDEPSVKRHRGRPSSVPPTDLTETEAVTPEMSLSSVRKESGLTGVRKLLKTPKSVQTPRVSGVSELFKDEPSVKRHRGRPSSVPPTDLTETEAVTPEMSLSSVRKESGLTGVRKLLKTPKSVQTPRVSGVSELFKDEPSVKRHRGRPSSVPPTDLTETEAVTPEMSLSSVRKESGLTGVRKLLKTPKSVQTPRVSGVSELFKDEPSVKRHRGRPSSVPPTDLTETEAVTPEMSLSSVRKESGLTGVRKLLKTPKSVQTPRVSGVSELFKDEPSGNVCYRVQNVSNVTSLSPSYCKLCHCLLFECQCSFGFNNLTGKRSRRRGLDDVAESLPSKRTRCVFKIAESSVVKSTDADYPVMKMSSRRLKYPSTNELTVQLSKTKSKNKKQVSTMGSQYSDALTDRSVNIVKSLENRTSKELPGLIIPLPNNVMGNNSRKRKSIPYKSRLTPSDNMLNSYDQSAPSNTVSLIPKTAKDRESVSVVPVAKRLRSRMTPSVIECLSSSRTRRAVKVPDSLIGESATTDSSGKSSMVKTSSRKVKSQSNKEVIIQPSKTISKTKKKVSSTDFQCPDSLLDHSVNAVKSTNNCASKRSIKRLADVRRVSPSIPLAKRLRNRIDQSDIKCVTSEHTRNEETSLPVKDQPSEKKRNGTKTNNLRNRKQVITSPSKPLPTASSSKSVSTNESKDITLKSKTRSRHIKRASVTPVDNITNVSPKRRVLRSWKVITPASEISQPIQEKISTSKITNKSKLKTTNNNSNNNSSVTSKSTQAKQSSISIRQTRSRTRQ
uniref:FHA domain-containing protein n=1 Tax=Schistosoma mansoni TaxID=6183 RepID=A0A5K4FEJ6_SCHMA